MSNIFLEPPSLVALPFCAAVSSGFFYVLGRIDGKGNQKMLAVAGAISDLADYLLYQVSYLMLKRYCTSSVPVYAVHIVTHALVSASTIIALRALNHISNELAAGMGLDLFSALVIKGILIAKH